MKHATESVQKLMDMFELPIREALADPMFRYLALNPNRCVFLGMANASGETIGHEVRRLDFSELKQVEDLVESIIGRRLGLQNPNAYVVLPGEGVWTGKWISVLTPPVSEAFSFTIAEYIPGL